jgi:transcriptional regulator with XRE-family HTH domain
MKQPELGRKLTEFRNEIGLTQEQLSEKTKINIRTIQQIESGEVMPRIYTLKTILEVLGRNYEEVNGDIEEYIIDRPDILKTAWIAAIIFASFDILLVAIVILRDLYGVRSGLIQLLVPVFIGFIILTVLLNRGIIYLGKTLHNSFLVITGYIGILLTILGAFAQIVQIYVAQPQVHLVAKAFLIMSAVNGIFYGVGIILLIRYINELALLTGVLMIFISFLMIIPGGFVELTGVILSVPCLLMQALILYRFQTNKFTSVSCAYLSQTAHLRVIQKIN